MLLISLLIIAGAVPVATAQESLVDYEHFSVASGLPTQTTYNLIQDRNGFLWIATDAGVSRFDGLHFENFTTINGLGDNEIISLYEDKKGRIWFMPFTSKLSYYLDGNFYTEENDRMLKSLSGYNITSMIEDYSGTVYARLKNTPDKIVKIGRDNLVTIINAGSIVNSPVSILHASSDKKNIYGITANNKWILLSADVPVEIKEFEKVLPANSLEWHYNPKDHNRLLYMNSKGLYLLNDTTSKLLIPGEKIPHTDGRFYMVMDKHNHIWVSNFMHNTWFFRYTDGGYLPAIHVLNGIFSIVAFDTENNIWFCTPNRGLYKTQYSKLLDSVSSYLNNALLHKNIFSIYAGPGETLWMGYGSGFVTQVNGKKIKHHNLSEKGRTFNRVIQIKPDNENNIWCAMDETSIMLKKTNGNTYVKHRLKMGTDVFFCASKGIAFDKKGTPFITLPMSITVVDKQRMQVEEICPIGEFIRVYSTFFDSKNQWYLSTIKGLYLINKQKTENLSHNQPGLNIRINHFAENSTGTIFLATYSNGLLALKDRRLMAKISHNDGLPGIICRRVYLKNDTLYIVTNGGISVVTYTNNRFTVLKNLDLLSGLPSLDVNDLTFSDNKLYAATSEGLAIITLPVSNRAESAPPILSVKSFRVNGTVYPLMASISFPYKEQRVRIEYIAPVMDKAAAVKYRYRFAGRDTTWNITTSGFLEFSDLPYGDFKIEIQAKKYNSNWSASKEILFTIIPPFYFTNWFKISMLLLSATLLYLLIRYRLTKRFRLQLSELKEKEAIEQERNRIAADLHDDIGGELTNIVIQTRILKKTVANQSYLSLADNIEKSSNEVINKMNEVIWTLNKNNDTLHNLAAYLRNYINRLLGEFRLTGTVIMDEALYSGLAIKADVSRNIFLIIKECLHNVVKHSGASNVEVRFALKHGKNLVFEVCDNGNGFNPAKNIPGNGLMNIKKRAEAIRGTVNIYSVPGGGCIVNISVPL